MKKVYLSIVLLLITAGWAFSQDLDISHPVLNYTGPNNTNLSAHAEIVNINATETYDVVVENYNPVLVPGHATYFCWVICYDTTVFLSPDFITLGPGASTTSFVNYVVPSSISGHDEITYRFYDKHGNSDTVYVTFTYDFTTVGILEMTTSKNLLSIKGPNPANTHTEISYVLSGQKDARIIVTNMLGSKVKEINLSGNQNTLTVPVKDLLSGVYVYSLVVDGKVMSSKKLIVSH